MTKMMGKRGFTLLELMAVVLIVSILAAMALPAYSRYMRKAARADAQTQMLKIAGDLERWRAKNLTYAGFTPEAGFVVDTSITAATNAVIYSPKGSTSSNYKYKLALLDGSDRTAPLTATSTATAGQRWILIAQPNMTNKQLRAASRLVLSSQGVRCMTDTAVDDATMKSNIAGTLNDTGLCVGTPLAW